MSHAGRRISHHHTHRKRRKHPSQWQMHSDDDSGDTDNAAPNIDGSRSKETPYSTSSGKAAGAAMDRNSSTQTDNFRMQFGVDGLSIDTGGRLNANSSVSGVGGVASLGAGSNVKVGLQGTAGGGGGGGGGGGEGMDIESGRWAAKSVSSAAVSSGRLVVARGTQDWMSLHHNPDSPLHSAPSSGPHTPKGQEVIENWDSWVGERAAQSGRLASSPEVHHEHEEFRGDPLLGGPPKKAGEPSRWWSYWYWIGGAKSKKLRQVTWVGLVVACLTSWWGTVYLVGGEAAGPSTQAFAAIALLLVAYASGEAFYRMLGIHPLLGSIAGGFVLRYVPGVEAGESLSRNFTGHIRNLALVIILLRAGLSLDVKSLIKIPELCLVAPTLPLVIEAGVVAVLMTWMLNFSWMWAFMAGFIVSAVSPGVVVPILLQLAEEGYGVDAGIPSLVLAVAALCDVLALVGFSAFEKAAFEGGEASISVAHVVSELIFGVLAGVLAGVLVTFLIPRGVMVETDKDLDTVKKTVSHDEIDGRSIATKRTFLLVGIGFVIYYTFKHYHYTGAAAMAAFVMGIPAAQGWGRRRTGRTQAQMARIWLYVAQPLLFGVIGARIDINMFSRTLLWKQLVILMVAGAIRWVVTVLVTSVGHLTVGERMFIASAWVSKATVQAAIGPTPLEVAAAKGDLVEIANGEKVLMLATLAILVAAPVGAILTKFLGPKLLTKGESKGVDLAGH